MKNYNRVMAGKQSVHAKRCFSEGFVGLDYGIHENLAGKLPDSAKEFNRAFIPVYLAAHPDKTRIAAGLACGFVWTMARGLREGDVVITPNGEGRYRAGEITGPYQYAPGDALPHRRPVRWYPEPFDRADMSEALQRSTNSTGTCCDITDYAAELEKLIGGIPAAPTLVAADPTVEDAASFALESHLEEFLVENWAQTELGRDYDIYEEDGEKAQQYRTDTGPLDILAISKDRKRLLVVELKKGRASDAVVGQTLRYMSYVQEVLAEPDQTVLGAIVALEDDEKIRRALKLVPAIAFYRYRVSFSLIKG